MNINRVKEFAEGDEINIVGDNEKFIVYDILQLPKTIYNMELFNYGHIIYCIQHDTDKDTLYIGYNSEEKRKECYDLYGQYFFEHNSYETELDWDKNKPNWTSFDIVNKKGLDYFKVWVDARKWIFDNIENSYKNVQWSRLGDGQYYRFKNKSDAILFKLMWC